MKTVLARERLALIAILALAVAPYFIGLGSSTLWDSNEAFYAETPREMIEAGDYLNPSFNYRPRFNKPPLTYWVVALFYKAFGVSELSERIPIALGALALIATAFALARIIFSFEAAVLSGLALAIAPRFLMFSRRIIIDIYLAMFMSAALLFFVLAEKYPERRRLFLLLMYASVGFGALTKGPVAILLPAIVLFIYLAAHRQLGKIRRMMLGWGAMVIAAIVLPWHLAVYQQHGWFYIKSFLLLDNLSRYTESAWGPSRGPLFYLGVVIGDMFPWSLFLIPALGFQARRFIKSIKTIRTTDKPDRQTDESQFDESQVDESQVDESARLAALLFIWIAVIIIFFTLSKSKEDLYILPSYPAAAALIGGVLSSFIAKKLSRFWHLSVKLSSVLLALILIIAGASALYLFALKAHYNLAGAGAIGALAVAGGLSALAALMFKKPRAAIAITAVAVVSLNWVFVIKTLTDFERYKPVRPFCEIIAREAAPSAEVGYYRFATPSMVYYLRQQVFEYYYPEELRAVFSSGKPVYCLMTLEDYEAIKDSLPAQTYILASRPVFQVKLKVVLEKTEPPQVVLISNRDGASSRQ